MTPLPAGEGPGERLFFLSDHYSVDDGSVVCMMQSAAPQEVEAYFARSKAMLWRVRKHAPHAIEHASTFLYLPLCPGRLSPSLQGRGLGGRGFLPLPAGEGSGERLVGV